MATKPKAKPPLRTGVKIPEHVGQQELAKLFGISAQQIKNLTDAGTLVREGHGKYPVGANVRRRIEYMVEKAVAKVKPETDPIEVERLRKLQRENDEAEGLVILVDVAVEAMSLIFGPLQTELSALIVNHTDDLEEREALDESITSVVNRLASTFETVSADLLAGRDPFAEDAEGETD